MRRRAPVRIHDDLAPGKAAVAHRAADHELAGRVAIEEILVMLESAFVVKISRQNRAQHVFNHVRLQLDVEVESVAVLRRDQHSVDFNGSTMPVFVLLVTHRHLGFPIWTQVRKYIGLPDGSEAFCDAMREHDRQGHEFVRLVRRIPEHHSLVARTDPIQRIIIAVLQLVRLIDALRDVR